VETLPELLSDSVDDIVEIELGRGIKVVLMELGFEVE
jgi:hypothetical protein